jgi:hypothetical protein
VKDLNREIGMSKEIDDIGLRFGVQDIEWLQSAVDLMLATGLGSASEQTTERMRKFSEQIKLQSALPAHSQSYADAYRFNDAVEALKTCSAWEPRLIVNKSSFFQDVTFAIETYEAGRRQHFKLTSNLSMGRSGARGKDPMELFGVYMSRLASIGSEVASHASQMREETVKVLTDWRAFYSQDGSSMPIAIAKLLYDGIGDRPFAVRSVELSRWSHEDSVTLPESIRYLDATISTTDRGHELIAEIFERYNPEVANSPGNFQQAI